MRFGAFLMTRMSAMRTTCWSRRADWRIRLPLYALRGPRRASVPPHPDVRAMCSMLQIQALDEKFGRMTRARLDCVVTVVDADALPVPEEDACVTCAATCNARALHGLNPLPPVLGFPLYLWSASF